MSPPRLGSVRHSDGYEAMARWWHPANPHGAVLHLHGIQSHGGWYEQSASALAERGFVVMVPDRRGCGLNKAGRGHADSVERLMADGRELIDRLAMESGFERVHVVGISWGGKWAAALAASPERRIASLSLVAPGIFPMIDVSVAEKFRIGWSMLAEPSRSFVLPLNDPGLFTENPARLEFVRGDPLRLLEASAAFLLASRRMERLAQRLAGSGWFGPVHLMLAGRERIIDNARTRNWFAGLAGCERLVSEFPDAAHTIEFEADPGPYLTALTEWIDRQARAAG